LGKLQKEHNIRSSYVTFKISGVMKLGPRDENSAMTGACSVPILVICGAILPIGFLQCEEKEEDCCNIIFFSLFLLIGISKCWKMTLLGRVHVG
jgi:hypothetical protein